MIYTGIIQTVSNTFFAKGTKILQMTIAHKIMDTQLSGYLSVKAKNISMKSALGVENVIQVLSHI